MVEVSIRQANPNSLFYYTIQVNDWHYDGDALDLEGALELIKHNLKYNYHEDEK